MISRRQIIHGQQPELPVGASGRKLLPVASSVGSLQQTTTSGSSSSGQSAASGKSARIQHQQLMQSKLIAKNKSQQAAASKQLKLRQQSNSNNNKNKQLKMKQSGGANSGARNELHDEIVVCDDDEEEDDDDDDDDEEEEDPLEDEDDILLHQQDGSSDGYIMNQYDDYMSANHQHTSNYWQPESSVGGVMHHQKRQDAGANYRHFDPYSIYNEDEDVWFSEERLFEDHLEEIYNKWRLLDDDIWCKLIIMERSRRIGKAYARVPIVTIDGSHELSYDGYKLALNGFDNPDRDARTEECRKRIGKGIRIKMDPFGNILIKRLSKSSVYIKEWLSPVNEHQQAATRHMPSRQQLIKNQNALLAAMSGAGGGANAATNALLSHRRLQSGSQVSSSATPSSSSGGSSMDPSNDSAVCDEILNSNGQLEQEKIYKLFDMEKFQANITQELCRHYPDKKKLEQQCFSIVGLVKDADEILDLSCWVMVINIVAIQMLNERFPPDVGELYPNPPVASHRGRKQAPNFVSIFDQQQQQQRQQQQQQHHHMGKLIASDGSNKEEDPYSLPANASSSDVKSSINDYGTSSTSKHMMEAANGRNQRAGYSQQQSIYFAGKRASDINRARDSASGQPQALQGELRHRSKSNHNLSHHQFNNRDHFPRVGGAMTNGDRYNNSTSIYSPGHMLVPPPGGDAVPPKLPPRRGNFSKDNISKSKSSSNVSGYDDPNNESIYSTGMILPQQPPSADGAKMRKVKKNRFLESLKAPLELATSRSAHRSASVIGAPLGGTNPLVQSHPLTSSSDVLNDKTNGAPKSSATKSSATKNIKSFLGVKSSKSKLQKQKQQHSASDDSNYVHVDAEITRTGNSKAKDESNKKVNGNDGSSYNDLDIPTPDYETDENAYALNEAGGNYAANRGNGRRPSANNGSHLGKHTASSKASSASTANHSLNNNNNNKEDLYYSGFCAHVPQKFNGDLPAPATGAPNGAQSAANSLHHDKLSSMGSSAYGLNGAGERGSRRNSRFSSHLMMAQAAPAGNASGRDMIYGSTTHLQQQQQPLPIGGSRYRSASMQRYYPAASMSRSHRSNGYDYDCENPYAMSQILLDDETAHLGSHHHGQDHYGYATGHITGRRPSSRLMQTGGAINGRSGGVTSAAQYDIGRSSSGIYGNNSSSSSSDYADWHPQMRKVNSGGYLNSIFKSHIATSPMIGNGADAYNGGAPANNNNNNNNNTQLNDNGNANPISSHGDYLSSKQLQQKQSQHLTAKKAAAAAQQQQQQQQQNYTSRTLKSATRQPTSLSSSKQQQHQTVTQQQQQVNGKQVASSVANVPTYRSYDSSNDSEPSYTNSSDGLDIYDQIGANGRVNRHQFLDMQAPHNIIAPEVHVGEWENMYDR